MEKRTQQGQKLEEIYDSEASQVVEADNLPIVDLRNHDNTAKSKESVQMKQIKHSLKISAESETKQKLSSTF